MKRKSRYEPLETDIAKILTPSGNHEKATTTTVTYDMVFDKLNVLIFIWTLETIVRSIRFNTEVWSHYKTNSERQFDNRLLTSRTNSPPGMSSTSLFKMRYQFTRAHMWRHSFKKFQKSRMKHFWTKSSAIKFNKIYLLCIEFLISLKFLISLTMSSACLFQGPPP